MRTLRKLSINIPPGYNVIIFTFQVILLVIAQIKYAPKVIIRMPLSTDKYAELLCEIQLEGFLIPLTYNLCLIFICALHGFLTRKLPYNFNESIFIFASVVTTSFLWIVLLPVYFTSFLSNDRVVLLALCLLLNASVTLTCLHFPKIYAVLFVEEETQSQSTRGQHYELEPVAQN